MAEEQHILTLEPTRKVVVFRLADEEYAVPVLDVQEILPYTTVTPFPSAPNFVEGIINIRGSVATVVNLSQRLQLDSLSAPTQGYILLMPIGKSLYGFTVDEVLSVLDVAESAIRPATESVASNRSQHLHGVAVVEGRVILLLDSPTLVDQEGEES